MTEPRRTYDSQQMSGDASICTIRTDMMVFHMSAGRSASRKAQSKVSVATGSSLGSWYGARYGDARDSVAEIRT